MWLKEPNKPQTRPICIVLLFLFRSKTGQHSYCQIHLDFHRLYLTPKLFFAFYKKCKEELLYELRWYMLKQMSHRTTQLYTCTEGILGWETLRDEWIRTVYDVITLFLIRLTQCLRKPLESLCIWEIGQKNTELCGNCQQKPVLEPDQ